MTRVKSLIKRRRVRELNTHAEGLELMVVVDVEGVEG